MSFLRQITHALQRGQQRIEQAQEGLAQAGKTLQAGADLCNDVSSKVKGSLDLGRRLGQQLTEGVEAISRPAKSVDVKVVDVKQNGVKR